MKQSIYGYTKSQAKTITIEQGLDPLTALNQAYIEYLELLQAESV